MSSSCTEMLVDHVRNLPPSLESIVFLRALLFDTCSFSEMYLCVEKSLQCRRNHRIEHIVVKKIVSHQNRSRCHKFFNWLGNLNFCDLVHCEMRICWFRTYFSLEVDSSALNFHRVRKFAYMQFRDGQSRILNQSYHRENKFHQYDFTIHLHFGRVVQVLTNSSVLVSFHSRSLCISWNVRSPFSRRGREILWIVEESRSSSFSSK